MGSILSNSSRSGKGGDITLTSDSGAIDTSAGILNASSEFGIGNGRIALPLAMKGI